MADSQFHIRRLFRSNLIQVLDYRCTGHDNVGEIPLSHEIVLPRTGAYECRDAHGTFLADPNQVVFYNKGEPYDIRHPIRGGDASTVFQLSPSLLIEMIRLYNPRIENHPHRLFQYSYLPLQTWLHLLQYQILGAHPSSDPLAWEEQIIAAVGEIIHALYQRQTHKRDLKETKTQRLHEEQVQSVKVFLNSHVRTRLQLEQISSAVHLSPFHLCRVFKRRTGMTLHQYLQRLRLFNAAEQMLESPAARLDLLALEYGFSNHGHFTTAFRQTFGVNPSDFRRMSRILKA